MKTLKATYIPQSTNRHQREIGLQTIFANIKHSQKIHRHLVMAAIDGHYELTPLSGYGITAGVVNFLGPFKQILSVFNILSAQNPPYLCERRSRKLRLVHTEVILYPFNWEYSRGWYLSKNASLS